MTDALGSVRGYLDVNNSVLSNINYGEYGVPDDAIIGPAFTGEWRSGNETQYHRARHLHPGLATWLSLDPFEGTVQRPMSLNGYSWVEGNTPNRVDSSGELSCGCRQYINDSRAYIACNNGYNTFYYNRSDAARAAWNLSRRGAASYPIAPIPAYSAMFISLALYAGGYPMTKAGPNDNDSDLGIDRGWRAAVRFGLIYANSVWQNHNNRNSYNAATDNRLIGYVYGSSEARPRGFSTSTSNLIRVNVDQVVDNPNTNRAVVNPTKLRSVIHELAGVQQGDYLFINSSDPQNPSASNTHGYIVVGKGAALKCDSPALRSIHLINNVIGADARTLEEFWGVYSGIPYVADWSGKSQRRIVPFYCSQPEFNHTYWEFISVPGSIFMLSELSFAGAGFRVTTSGNIVIL